MVSANAFGRAGAAGVETTLSSPPLVGWPMPALIGASATTHKSRIGDLSEALGDHAAAASYFRVAEQIERAAWESGQRQPQALAKVFAEHHRDIPEAVRLAEEAAQSRRDIFTMDTLALAYLKAGRLVEARRAADQALRTGSRDARVLWHAAEIRATAGDPAAAIELLRGITSIETIGDVRVRSGIRALQERLAN